PPAALRPVDAARRERTARRLCVRRHQPSDRRLRARREEGGRRQGAAACGVPPGLAGQYRYLERAKARLAIVVPVTLAIIFMLLFFNSGSAVEALLVMLAVPFSLVGAFWLLWLLGYNMSVAVWVGLIALAGLDAETGIVML